MAIYVDCTDTRSSNINTGIQRVVRNIINNLQHTPKTEPKFIPIYTEAGSWFKLTDELRHDSRVQLKKKIRRYFRNILKASIELILAVLPLQVLRTFFFSKNAKIGLHFWHLKFTGQAPIAIQKGDTLVLLDATWNNLNIWTQITALRQNQVRIVTVVYDLIPITNPEYFDADLRNSFETWAKSVIKNSDEVLAISKATLDEVKKFANLNHGGVKRYRYFHLGSDLDGAKHSSLVRKEFSDIFRQKTPVFLTVGTIEPRKNHKFILEGFRIHLKKAPQARLLILGKMGWLMNEFSKTLKSDPLFGSNIFWIENASDSELEFAYSKSSALIFASKAEGFGLPLVEARQRGLPVIASDIPVFREISDEFVSFFSIENTSDLARAIEQCPTHRNEMKWMNWKDSTKAFRQAILSSD